MTQHGPGNFEDLLRRSLAAQAETVDVEPDALSTIRQRISRRRARWWIPRIQGGTMITLSTSAALAAAVVTAVIVGTNSCLPATAPNPPAASSGPASPAPRSPAPSGTPAGATTTVAVYYLGTGDKLFREFHPVTVAGTSATAKISAALTAMLAGAPSDPDYHDGWPAGARLRSVSVSGSTVTVDLSGVTSVPAAPAVQQLVWTATQVAGLTGVRLLLGGRPAGAVLHRGSSVDVLAPIWVIDPQQGATVGRTFTVQVNGTAFEATCAMRIRNASGTVVVERSLHVGSAAVPNRLTASVTVTLAPGTYTVEGFVFSAKDSSVVDLDNHVFTVR